jgi:carboxymethylenebutenolidase
VIGRSGSDVLLGDAEHGEVTHGVVGYRALPASGRGRGVLVLHAGASLAEDDRDTCDRLARAGFAAVAPDLSQGCTGSHPAAAPGRAAGPAAECALAAIDAAVHELLCNDATEGPQVGALGFGDGGVLALRAAMHNRRIGVVVDFYGAALGSSDIAPLDVEVLAVVGDKDEIVSEAQMRSLASCLEAAGARVHVRVQPGVGHGFMNEERADRFDAAAAAQGWDAALAYLRAEL